MNFSLELRHRLTAALAVIIDDAKSPADPATFGAMLKESNDARHGDFQANCVMPLSGQLKCDRRVLAEKIIATMAWSDLCSTAEVAGPGFINFRLRDDLLAAETRKIQADDRLGVATVDRPLRYVVDFSSPNVAKPMHVGHLRSTVLGHSLYRTLKFLGHTVTSDNHVGDWGTQFGMIIYGYKHFRDDAAYAASPVAELARLYRLVSKLSSYHELPTQMAELDAKISARQKQLELVEPALPPAERDKAIKVLQKEIDSLTKERAALVDKRAIVDSSPALKSLANHHLQIAEKARQETALLHQGDAINLGLWREFLPKCLDVLNQLYERFGLKFDLSLGESAYNPMLANVVAQLVQSGIAVESDQAKCVFVEGNDAPFIVQKKDGAFTYATTDLATIEYRLKELQAEVILYVVDARQSEHFQLLFATAKKAGLGGAELRHISFGTILGDDRRPFKTRSGDTVGLESLLDEAIARALQIVEANQDPNDTVMEEATKLNIAEIVGIGGIIYADLHHNRDSDYVFSWDKMLAIKGDTATYMQYAYARTRGIFRKAGVDPATIVQAKCPILLTCPEERALALLLNRFGATLHDMVVDYRPNLLTAYLFELANTYSKFFENCPVVKEPDEATRNSRLTLCSLTGRVIAKGLDLLGIRVSERM